GGRWRCGDRRGRRGAVGRERAAPGRGALRERDQGPRADRQRRAERARSAHCRDLAEEPRGDRSGDQREPRRGPLAAGERAGAAEPDRELQDQDCAAAGHGGADQRNAQRERGRRRTHRVEPQGKGRVTMRLISALLLTALAAARPALAQDEPHRVVVREAVRGVTHGAKSGAYQGRDRGSEQTDRFSRKVKLGRDGRVSISNISGNIAITGGSGDEVTIDAVKRTRGDQGQLANVRIVVDDRPGRVDVRTEYDSGRTRNNNVSVDYTVTVPNGASVEAKSVSGNVKVTGVRGAVRTESVSGDVTTVDTPKVEAAKSVSGNVMLSGIQNDGELSATSVSGTVTAKGVKTHALDLGSVSGDLLVSDV